MNLQDLGNIGEFVGSIGVVASLIYLGVQIRAQNDESRSAVINNLTQQWAEFMRTFIESGDAARLWLEGLASYPDVPDEDKIRFGAILSNASNIAEALLKHHEARRLDEDAWASFRARLEDIFSNPGAQRWWPQRRHWYTSSFQALIDEIIAASEGPKMFPGYDIEREMQPGRDG